jgi:hypothetical protein
MFNADGSYSLPDQATPHALVVTETFTGRSQGGFPTPPYPKGFVLAVQSLGATNIAAGQGPQHPKAALIEHATAKVGDVLTDADVAAGVALAATRQAAVANYRAAEAAKPQPPAGPTLEQRVAALEAKVK